MIIDTHSHLNLAAFDKDREEIIKRTLGQNVWMVNVGTNYQTSQKAVEITQNYKKGVYAAVGLHPMHATADFLKPKSDPSEGVFEDKETFFEKEKYKNLILTGGQKIVAVGEIGLDYYYKPKTVAKLQQFKEKQKQILLEQLDLAKELNLPVILHCRMAHQDLITTLQHYNNITGVVHCFTGTVEEMQEYIKMGFYIGFNGIIFKLPLDEAIKNCPLENMLLETDCPYLTPPQEENIRNESIFIKHTIQKISDLKGAGFEKICQETTENGKKLFRID